MKMFMKHKMRLNQLLPSFNKFYFKMFAILISVGRIREKMETYQDEDELFEEDVVFDHAGLLDSTTKTKTAIRRISTGKCALFAKTLGLCGAFFGL
ncbi:hypothetical protein J437_LFUL016773, partial [Ladona fulva]